MKSVPPFIIALGLAPILTAQEKCFGKPEMKLAETREQEGKTILRYQHESVPEWGYEIPQSDYEASKRAAAA